MVTRPRSLLLLAAALLTMSTTVLNAAVIHQSAEANYVAFEAETNAELISGGPTVWELREDGSASGGRALEATGAELVNLSPQSFALYDIQFLTPGTYSLYYRWRANPLRTTAEAFAANGGWLARAFGRYTTAGAQAPFYVSASNSTSAPANHQYSWQKEPNNNVYQVEESDPGMDAALAFTIGARESGMILDRIVFSLAPDLSSSALDALSNSNAGPPPLEPSRAVGSASLDTVTITFTRPLDPQTVEKNRFIIEGGITVNGATLSARDASQAVLTTSDQIQGTPYSIRIDGVTDRDGVAIAENASVRFTAWREVKGWVQREIFLGIDGDNIAALQQSEKFPSAPDRVEWIKRFDMDNDPYDTNYGARLTAFFDPPATGVYEFFHRNDDEAQLFVSFDDTESGFLLEEILPATPHFSETAFINFPPELESGRKYLVVGLLKQGGGDALLSVAAREQGANAPVASLLPVSGNQVSTFVNPDFGEVQFIQHPRNAIGTIGSRSRFAVKVTSEQSPIYYQWRVNGTDIPGAMRSAYTTPILSDADDGKKYRVVVSVAGRETASDEAALSVIPGELPKVEPYVGVNFLGGHGAISGKLTPVDVAGVVPQANWNNIAAAQAVDVRLAGALGQPSPVQLTFNAGGVTPTGTRVVDDADSFLLQGSRVSETTEPMTFAFHHVPSGPYNMLVYCVSAASETPGSDLTITARGLASYPSYRVTAQSGEDYLRNPGFQRMLSTSSTARDTGNYVQFDGVAPDANGTISLTVTADSSSASNNPSGVVNAIQLAKVLSAVSPSLVVDENERGDIVISWDATASGFTLQWTDVLESNANWRAADRVPNPLLNSGTTVVTVTERARFYRLRD